MPTETEVGVDGNIDLPFAGGVRGHIQIAVRVRRNIVDSGRNDPALDRFGADDRFKTAGGTEPVAHGTLGTADPHFAGVITEHRLDRLRFVPVVQVGGSTVGIDVVHP